MKNALRVSPAVIRRLPRYLRILEDIKREGLVDRVSSITLGSLAGCTASQVRQDLNNFGRFGTQGYGYNVEALIKKIELILGLDKRYSMVVVGAGNLGHAITNFIGQYGSEFEIKAIFDINPKVIGQKLGGVGVQDVKALDSYLEKNATDIGVITSNSKSAQGIADALEKGGVKGVWNFTISEIQLPDDIALQNVRISDSLHILSFHISSEFYPKRD